MNVGEMSNRLSECYDVSGWWPAGSEWEVMVGAILVQQTTWESVEKVLDSLKERGAMDVGAMASLPLEELQELVRPAGFYRQKASRIKGLAIHIVQAHASDPRRLLEGDADDRRKELLAQPGIGEETADAILLFAGRRPRFIAAAYVRRLLDRLGILSSEDYGEVQRFMEAELPRDAELYVQLYALMVHHARTVCRSRPRCQACCLRDRCRFNGIAGRTDCR